MKVFAVVTDVSPTEQLTGNDDETKSMGMVVGLHHKNSFDEVGQKFPDPDHQFRLRKWSGSSNRYKSSAIEHARFLEETGNVMFGVNVTSERLIREYGSKVFQKLTGPYPEPESYSRKGKPRIVMGGYAVDGVIVESYRVLQEELDVLGWYTESIASFHRELIDINEEDVMLDVIVDRLPLEQGGENYHKATLLRRLLQLASNNLINLAGIPEKSDSEPRDLLVDNIAGMGRELAKRPESDLSKLILTPQSVFRVTRINI